MAARRNRALVAGAERVRPLGTAAGLDRAVDDSAGTSPAAGLLPASRTAGLAPGSRLAGLAVASGLTGTQRTTPTPAVWPPPRRKVAAEQTVRRRLRWYGAYYRTQKEHSSSHTGGLPHEPQHVLRDRGRDPRRDPHRHRALLPRPPRPRASRTVRTFARPRRLTAANTMQSLTSGAACPCSRSEPVVLAPIAVPADADPMAAVIAQVRSPSRP